MTTAGATGRVVRRATGATVALLAFTAVARADVPVAPAPSGAVPPAAAGAGAPVAWPLTGGISVRLTPPPSGEVVPDADLPKLDLSSVEDAKMVVARGLRRAPATADHLSDVVSVICATAPGARLPSEAVPLVLDKIAELTRADLAKTTAIDRFEDGVVGEAVGRWEQPFSGDGHLTAASAKLPVHIEGRRLVGYVGAAPDALVCAVVCTEVSSESGRVCPAVIATVAFDGPFVAPAKSSLPSRVLFAAVRRPLSAAGTLLGFLLFAAGVLIAALPGKRGRISSR